MYWLKLCALCVPLLLYGGLIYGNVVPLAEALPVFAGTVGFLLGGLSASAIHELELWVGSLSDVYGSASFAHWGDLTRAGLFGKAGVILGRYGGQLIRLDQPGHLLTLAPTRAGKGTCAVIPNLLDHPGSAVVVDIKGENIAIAGRHRQNLGLVFSFAPFAEKSHAFNPFDFVRGGEDAWDDAALLADMLIVPSGDGKALFFENEARALLTGIILYVATEMPHKRRNLAHVRHLITLDATAFDHLLDGMGRAKHPLVRRAAASFGQKEIKLRSSILAEAQSHTLIFDSERVARVTSHSDFDLEWLKNGNMSLFLVVPPEHLGVYRPLVRLILGLAVNAMTRQPGPAARQDAARKGAGAAPWAEFVARVGAWLEPRGSRPDVLFLVDEFAALGYMKPLRDGIAYLAGYGVKLWLFAQDLGQLESIYGEATTRSIVANTSLQAFGNTDNATLEMLSRMLGHETVRVRQRSMSRHSFVMPDYDRFNVSAGETGRPLMAPDEIRCLGNDRQLLFIRGVRPILARKTPYFKERRYRGMWDKWNQ